VKVIVDDHEVQALAKDAQKAFRQLPRAFDRAGKDAAKRARAAHSYVNRTGRTERETVSQTGEASGRVVTIVVIDVPHASYLMKGGRKRRPISLTNMESQIEAMERELEYFVEGIEQATTK